MDDRVVWALSPSFPVAFPREPAGGSVAAVKSTGQGGPSRAQKAAQCPQNCGAPGPGAGHLRRGARARKEAWGRRVGMGVVHRQHSAPGDPGPPHPLGDLQAQTEPLVGLEPQGDSDQLLSLGCSLRVQALSTLGRDRVHVPAAGWREEQLTRDMLPGGLSPRTRHSRRFAGTEPHRELHFPLHPAAGAQGPRRELLNASKIGEKAEVVDAKPRCCR